MNFNHQGALLLDKISFTTKNLIARSIFIHIVTRYKSSKEKHRFLCQKVPYYEEFINDDLSGKLYLAFVPLVNDKQSLIA